MATPRQAGAYVLAWWVRKHTASPNQGVYFALRTPLFVQSRRCLSFGQNKKPCRQKDASIASHRVMRYRKSSTLVLAVYMYNTASSLVGYNSHNKLYGPGRRARNSGGTVFPPPISVTRPPKEKARGMFSRPAPIHKLWVYCFVPFLESTAKKSFCGLGRWAVKEGNGWSGSS